MVMESLQDNKEQIQLVISPDTESPRKRTDATLLYLVRIRFYTWAGKGKANMTVNDGRHQQLSSMNPPKCPTTWAEHFLGTMPRCHLHKIVLAVHSHE